ncbi:MAG: S-layer homology domain-containing protein [Ruminococcaceae bacterium]|nr:S-layer homology domain-containing protein [Oscillospiraceae bacterium]
MKRSIFKVILTTALSCCMVTSAAFAHGGAGGGNTAIRVLSQPAVTYVNVDANISFGDIGDYGWAQDAIITFARRGIVQGVGNNRFAPGQLVSREEFAKMLTLTFDASVKKTNERSFSDVPTDRWSHRYVEACKEYLTVYKTSANAKPEFRPEEAATREDIAVALVRMMGLSDEDVRDANYLKRTFSDYAQISPKLMGYVAVAAERGLLKGYEDGTFRPQQSINRAETVVLLNRSFKQVYGDDGGKLAYGDYGEKQAYESWEDDDDDWDDVHDDFPLFAKVTYGNNPSGVLIVIETEKGARVTVDGEEIIMSATKAGYIGGSYSYEFKEEGSKTFKIVAHKNGETETKRVTAHFSLDAPVLRITTCPQKSESREVVIGGRLTDENDANPTLTVNGYPVKVDKNGFWEYTARLSKQGENRFEFVATNHMGKESRVVKSIDMAGALLRLNVTDCPRSSHLKSPMVEGSITGYDPEDVTLTVNGRNVIIADDGTWATRLNLKEGENTVTFTAVDALGNEVTVERQVRYTPKEKQEQKKEEGKPLTLTVTEIVYDSTEEMGSISGEVTEGARVTVGGIPAMVEDGWFTVSIFCPIDEEWEYEIIATDDEGNQLHHMVDEDTFRGKSKRFIDKNGDEQELITVE